MTRANIVTNISVQQQTGQNKKLALCGREYNAAAHDQTRIAAR